MTTHQLLAASARRHRAEGAVFAGTDQRATWAELHERSLRVGAGLRALQPAGARVVLASGNRAEYLEAMFGVWAAGQVVTPLNAKLHARELQQAAQDSGAEVALTSPELAAALRACVPTVIAFGSPAWEALLATAPAAAVEGAPDDLAWLFFTSGTTGRAKGAMLSHRNLLAMALAHVADLDRGVEPGSCLLHGAPLSHGSGLYVLPYVMRGARQVVPESGGFDPAEFIALAQAHPGAAAFLAPTMVRRLRLELESGGHAPSPFRALIYGGGPMYLEEIKPALAAFGPVLSQLYGQGEAPMTIAGLARSEHEGASDATLASVGWARSGVEVRVVDAAGQALATGEVGEIVCRGDVVMGGYWNNPDATAAALQDGWLRTGDLGELDDTGRLTLRDRSKDVIISGGSNIYPREVEEALLHHPEVAEVCVLALPDADWGEVVAAVVVRRAGSQVGEAALEACCLQRIARFKKPKRYLFVDALPKTPYGKVAKREVLQAVSQQL